jgi:hypothetical protein
MNGQLEASQRRRALQAELSLARRAIGGGLVRSVSEIGWLDGSPMDPSATDVEPLPRLPGFPFLHAGVGALVSGPTGGGRSSLVQACAYDAAKSGLRVAYLGGEVTEAEFNARAADLVQRRDDALTDELRVQLGHVRYLDLVAVIGQAWQDPERWIGETAERFAVVLIDPLSSVAAALDLDFDKSNADFVRFYDTLVRPLTAAGLAVVLLENIGHDTTAHTRPKGASAKQDRADLTFSCKLVPGDTGLLVTARKVRSVRAPFRRDDEWLFDRETQRVELAHTAAANASEPTRPTALMERLSRAIEQTPGIGKREIRALRGSNRGIDRALSLLLVERYVEAGPAGPGKRQHHHSLKRYREDEDPHRAPVPRPCPHRAEAHPEADRAPVPLPIGGTGTGHTPALADEGGPA